MKIVPRSYFSFEIFPENDAEKVWLSQFLEGFGECRSNFHNHIEIDYGNDCVISEVVNGEEIERTAQNISLEQALTKEGKHWGLVERIEFTSSGF